MDIVESRSIDYTGGLTGCKVLSGTSANTGAFQSFVVNADSVVAQILNEAGTDITSSLGLSGATIKIAAAKGSYFSSITLTSGSIIAYLK